MKFRSEYFIYPIRLRCIIRCFWFSFSSPSISSPSALCCCSSSTTVSGSAGSGSSLCGCFCPCTPATNKTSTFLSTSSTARSYTYISGLLLLCGLHPVLKTLRNACSSIQKSLIARLLMLERDGVCVQSSLHYLNVVVVVGRELSTFEHFASPPQILFHANS